MAFWLAKTITWAQGFSVRRLVISALFLACALALPSGVHSYFDGMPLSNRPESMAMLVLLPMLCLMAGRFLGLRRVWLGISLILVLKIALCVLSPQSGWNVRIYDSRASLEGGLWESSYDTIWHKGHTTLLKRPWKRLYDFPIGWINRINDYEQRKSSQRPRFQLRPYLTIHGFARLPAGSGLALVASGLASASATARDPQGRVVPVPIVANENSAQALPLDQLPQGKISLEAKFQFSSINGPGWKLYPVMILPHGQIQLPFKKDILWATPQGLHLSPAYLYMLRILAKAADTGMILLFILWSLFSLWWLRRLNMLDWRLAAVSALALFLPGLLRTLVERHAGGVMALSQGMVAASVALILFSLRDDQCRPAWARRSGLLILLAFGPGLFAQFIPQWWDQVLGRSLLSVGDDWLTYQQFAREIVLQGNWWQSNIKVLTYQPLYRYVTALLHILFGPTMFATRMFDVWAVLGGAALTAAVARRLGGSLPMAILAAALTICHYTGDRFLFLIGKGLQEYVAMLLMMAAGFCVLASRSRRWWAFMGAGCLGALAELTRIDHLGVVLALGLFVLQQEPLPLLPCWRDFWVKLRGQWARVFLYILPVMAALLALAARNYFFGGSFTLVSAHNVGYLRIKTIFDSLRSVQMVLNAGDYNSITAYILWGGLLVGLAAALWRPKFLWSYPLSLSVALAALPLPYFLARANAYFPRWSIHLLPLAAISVVLSLQGLAGRPWFRAWSGLCKTPGHKAPSLWLSLPVRCGMCAVVALYLRSLIMPHWHWTAVPVLAVCLALVGFLVRRSDSRRPTAGIANDLL